MFGANQTTLSSFLGLGSSSPGSGFFPPAPKQAAGLKLAPAWPGCLKALGPSAGERVHVTVGVSGEALNIRPDVKSVVDGKGRVLRVEMQIAHRKWEEGRSKKAIRETLRRPRVVGAPT